MFKNLPFAFKIGLLPVVGAIAFVVILSTSWFMGKQGINAIVEIEEGYYASLEHNRKLAETLELIQRSLQDVAASADLDLLQETDALRDVFSGTLERAMANARVDVSPLRGLTTDFNQYYELAKTTTRQFADGNLDDSVFAAIEQVNKQVAALQEQIDGLIERDRAHITNAFGTTKLSTQRSTQILMVVIVLSLAVLILLSVLIIRMASGSVRKTVRGMDALVAGCLDTNIEASSNDEMGQMVSHVGVVTSTIKELAAEMDELIEAVRAGKLDVRGNPDKFQGAYASLVDNINCLIDEFVAPIEATGDYVERIARGDIPPAITDDYQGDFNRIKGNLNTLVQVMGGLVSQTADLTSAAQAGELDRRGDTTAFSGVWSDLIAGINETIDAVTEPLQAVSNVMSSMARGDLTQKISGNYRGTFAELQDDINSTIDRLTDVIATIKTTGDAVWVASHEIADGNRSLLQRTEEQGRSLEHTTGNMQHMTSIVHKNSTNAERASQTVEDARDKAQKGGDVVGRAMRAMDEINASSNKISEIIGVINEIAFQTNLLALNASVEAARAGEDGRGFAVVASEVRNLAGRSANAAKEIGELIQDSVGKVEEGSRLVNESGKTLDEIVGAVADVTAIVGDISTSSTQQAGSIESVNEAVAQMEQITRQNSTLVNEATHSSETMGAEARRLKEATAFFKVRDEAAAASPQGRRQQQAPLKAAG